MRLLYVFRHRKSVEPFAGVIRRSLERGHTVRILVQEADEKVPALFEPHPELSFSYFALGRGDAWRDAAPLLRTARDYLQYLGPAYRGARKLRNRAFERLLFQLALTREAAPEHAAEAALAIPEDAVARLNELSDLCETAIPSDPFHERLLAEFRPDAVLASPLVHFGSAQADFVKSARAMGIPVGMLLFSWDNLSTKGALHVSPDRLFVWNERQRREAWELHGFDPDRTRITGAARFDPFFALTPTLTREAFCAPLGIDPSKAILLYLCSSRLVAEREPAFIREWRSAIRSSTCEEVRDATLIVRPHPDLPVQEKKWLGPEETGRWDGMDVVYHARRMFGDRTTILLHSASAQSVVLHECLYHSRAAVGLNTSAEIESAIVGRPVFTILADESQADGQRSTLHFSYLSAQEGGWVTVSPSLEDHERRLAAALTGPSDEERIHRLVEQFVRPLGWDVPASHVLVDAIEKEFREWSGGRAETRGEGRASAPASPPRFRSARETRRLPSGEEVRVVPVEYAGADLRVAVSSEEEERQAQIGTAAPAITRWLPEVAAVGRPLFMIAPGPGAIAIAAARGCGATVFAFEADIPTLGRLWDNVLLNDCEGNVVPVPVAIGSKRALQEQRTVSASPGAARYPARRRAWHEHQGSHRMVMQPCLAMPLDSAMKTWGLPAPHALYIGPYVSVEAVITGARRTLDAGVAAILVECRDAAAADALNACTAAGFELRERAEQPDAERRSALRFARR